MAAGACLYMEEEAALGGCIKAVYPVAVSGPHTSVFSAVEYGPAATDRSFGWDGGWCLQQVFCIAPQLLHGRTAASLLL